MIFFKESLLKHESETTKEKRSDQHEVSCYLCTLHQLKVTEEVVRLLELSKDEVY